MLQTRIAQKLIKQACSTSAIRLSSFTAPQRPTIKPSDNLGDNVEGRENPMIFSDEYIPPQVLPEWHDNKLKNKLERLDCLQRRQMIDIPEFYPGSIVAVTTADEYSKSFRFVGRVLCKDGFGLRCKFILRNVIDGEGADRMYLLYSPMIQKIEVLRLEKWLDTDLRYLRDADPKYCTIDPNMIPEAPTPVTQQITVFKDKVKMGDRTWWGFKFDRSWPPPQNAFIEEHLVEEDLQESKRIQELVSWRKYDICRHYDTRSVKKKIMKEMKSNQKKINKITRSSEWSQQN